MRSRARLQAGAALGAIVLAACTGPAGDPGPAGEGVVGDKGETGPSGDPAEPSIAAVTPDRVFLERTVELEISGAGTEWTDEVRVELDTVNEAGSEDIEVLSVKRASPTALLVSAHVTAHAALGLRDIAVSDGGVTTRYQGAFNVNAPLAASFYAYQPFQGAVLPVYLDQTDFTTPFEPRFTFSYLADGAKFRANVVGPYQAFGWFAIDVLRPPGPTDLIVEHGPEDDPIYSIVPGGLVVKERVPQLIEAGSATATFTQWDSQLLSFDANAGQLITLTASASKSTAGYELAVLPPSGRFDEQVDYSYQMYDGLGPTLQLFAPTDGRYYLSVRPFGSELDYDVHVDVDREAKVPIVVNPPETIQRDILVGVGADVFEVHASAGEVIKAEVGPGALDSCGPAGYINAEVTLVDASGALVGQGWYPTGELCPNVSFRVEADGDYYLRVSPSLHGPYSAATPDQWLCVPLELALCGFDYSLTVTVQ